MFKRATWAGVGFGLGVGATVVAGRKVRRRIERYQPRALGSRVSSAAGTWRDRVGAAVSEGRDAAALREQELRDRLPR